MRWQPILALMLIGCGSAPVELPVDSTPRNGRGAALTRPEDFARVPKALDPDLLQVSAKAILPDSFSLDPAKLAPVLNQGALESCGAFGLAYETCGFATGLDLSNPANCMSPAFMYKVVLQAEQQQAATDTDGTYAKDYYDYLVKNGAANLSSCPYPTGTFHQLAQTIDSLNPANFTSDPRFSIGHWAYITKYKDPITLKQFLVSGQPVGILVELSNNFDNFYHNSGVFVAQGPHNAGGHFMCLVGYDDSRQAFRVQNSWGTQFGNQGYFWWDYTTFLSSLVEAHVAYAAQGKPITPSGGSLGGAGRITSASQSRQADLVHLVLHAHLDQPVKLLALKVRGPSGPTIVHRLDHYFRSGPLYITRSDAHQWPAGPYTITLQTAQQTLQTQVHLASLGDPLPSGPPMAVTGSNGQSADLEP